VLYREGKTETHLDLGLFLKISPNLKVMNDVLGLGCICIISPTPDVPSILEENDHVRPTPGLINNCDPSATLVKSIKNPES